MKTKIYFFALFLFVGINVIQAQEWGYVSTLTGEEMHKICTQGLDTVYIVGENGLIARSIDQGETWEKQYFPTKTALNDIIFIDYYTGFSVGEQGTILKTTDAGETWEQRPIDAASNLNAIAATGLDNIWAVGDNSLILHSSDAGATWEQVNILPETNVQLSDIAFRGSLGYFTGDNSTVYKTIDGGVSWNSQALAEQSVSNSFYSINVMENKTYIMGIGEYWYINDLYSTKNQANWILVSSLSGNNISPFFLNDSIGYYADVDLFTGSNGLLYISKTVDGGKSWNRIEDQYQYNGYYGPVPSDIKMINDMLGYAIFSSSLLKIPAPYKDPQGIKKIQNNAQLYIYQTTDNELVLKTKSNPIQSIEVFDTIGKKMIYKQFQNPPLDLNIDISNLPKGIYLIKVTQKNNIISTEKFLIK